MRILITGGAGCLGSNLIEHWHPRGHSILAIDNFATARRETLAGVPGVRLVEGSIADRALVERCFTEFAPTHVVHSAAAYKDPNDWREDTQTNVLGTINVVEAAKQAGVTRFVNFQTALVYGRPDKTPIPIDHPCRPITSYGASKLAGETYVALSGLPFVSLRIANVTAPRLSIGPIPSFYKRLKSGQSCFCSEARRDFLDFSDFVALVDLVMENTARGGIFNASTGAGYSIRQVYDVVGDYLGFALDPPKMVPLGVDDIAEVVLDPGATRDAFGWQARMGFAESIRRVLDWYDTHGVDAVHSHLRAPAGTR
jgi:UDP-glucose 4-epimerase